MFTKGRVAGALFTLFFAAIALLDFNRKEALQSTRLHLRSPVWVAHLVRWRLPRVLWRLRRVAVRPTDLFARLADGTRVVFQSAPDFQSIDRYRGGEGRHGGARSCGVGVLLNTVIRSACVV